MSQIRALAVQPKGSTYDIVAAGVTSGGAFGMVRYEVSGWGSTLDASVDTNFDVNVNLLSPVATGSFRPDQLAIESDGSILVAGYVTSTNGNEDLAVAHYTADGTLDTSFGSGGLATAGIDAYNGNPAGLALTPDGGIIVAGTANLMDAQSGYEFALAQFASDGTLDPSFGAGDGVSLYDFGNHDNHATSLAVQSDGGIVVGGV